MKKGAVAVAFLAVAVTFGAGGAAAQEKPAEGTASKAERANPFTGQTEAVAEGKRLYMKWGCYGCHGTAGGGGMGPSLIDTAWLYGATDADVFQSIHEGRPKGMPPWADKLSEEEIWKVTAYVRSVYKGDQAAVVW